MTITIERESCAQIVPDIGPLLQAHWREVALYQDAVPLAPDMDRYRGLEKAGKLVVVAARDDARLIGYSVFLLHNHLHYMTCRVASNDVLFLSPEYRKGTTAGVRLVRESERMLTLLGVNRITWHIKPANDWSAILERLGYDLEEKIMGKLLTGANRGL